MEPAGPARLQGWLAAILTADITGGLRLIELNEEEALGPLERNSGIAAKQPHRAAQRYVTFQMAEVAASRLMFRDILMLITRLRAPPAPAGEVQGWNATNNDGKGAP